MRLLKSLCVATHQGVATFLVSHGFVSRAGSGVSNLPAPTAIIVRVSDTSEVSARKPIAVSVLFILVAALGLLAAFALTLEKIHALTNPGEAASCDFSVIVQCGKNLASWQGSLLGFPNPLLGLMGWPVVAATGVGVLAGARFANWYWRAFDIVASIGFLFTVWLFTESVFVLGTLCPWCMVTWIATITLTIVVKGYTIKNGVWGTRPWILAVGAKTLSWSPTIIIGILLIEALIAQVRLDWIHNL